MHEGLGLLQQSEWQAGMPQRTSALQVAFSVLYFMVYLFHLYHTFKQLDTRPYRLSKLSNMLFRIQVRGGHGGLPTIWGPRVKPQCPAARMLSGSCSLHGMCWQLLPGAPNVSKSVAGNLPPPLLRRLNKLYLYLPP